MAILFLVDVVTSLRSSVSIWLSVYLITVKVSVVLVVVLALILIIVAVIYKKCSICSLNGVFFFPCND